MTSSVAAADQSVVPPELTGAVPRRVRFDPVTLVFPLVMVLVLSGIPTYSVVTRINDQGKLRQNSAETLGEVERLLYVGRSNVPTVRYSFSVDERGFTGSASVPEQLFKTLRQGDVLTIRYVPSNPSISHPTEWEWSPPGAFGFLLPFFGLPFAIIYWIQIRSQRRLAIAGLPAVATVTDCTAARNGLVVKYDFSTEDGLPCQGSSTFPRRKDAGDRICILYLPDNPDRNIGYPLTAFRVLPAGEF